MKTACQIANTKYSTKVHYTVLLKHALTLVICYIKGAVCRILTLLKHKNTIICLQTFRKHVKLTYLFI